MTRILVTGGAGGSAGGAIEGVARVAGNPVPAISAANLV